MAVWGKARYFLVPEASHNAVFFYESARTKCCNDRRHILLKRVKQTHQTERENERINYFIIFKTHQREGEGERVCAGFSFEMQEFKRRISRLFVCCCRVGFALALVYFALYNFIKKEYKLL